MNQKGLTLIEVLASIVILSIIGMSLLTFFVQSARSNNLSKNMMDATYVAQTQIEEINNFNQKPTSISVLGQKLIDVGFTSYSGSECTSCYRKGPTGDNRYIYTTLRTHKDVQGKDAAVNVLVQVYRDSKREAQMEMFLPWRK
jgi:prepilin-type N-terminal cleavage/methylation domain-containing protein